VDRRDGLAAAPLAELLPELRALPDPDARLASIPAAAWLDALGRLDARLHHAGVPPTGEQVEEAWELLDWVRRPAVLRGIPADAKDELTRHLVAVIDRTHLTTGRLFLRRAHAYGGKTLFELADGSGTRRISWRQAAARVDAIAGALLALDPQGPGPVAILSENRLEMALADLACFRAGIVSVMLPANSTPKDVGYMLRHSAARTVLVSDAEQLRKVAPHARGDLRHVVAFDARAARDERVGTPLEALLARARTAQAELDRRLDSVKIDDLATVMYTSGTTGNPKGIRFSHRNIVTKRFARAVALPELGESDVFLCYLPLYHTFGRFFEMMGSVFWGATYCFVEDPSVDSLLQGMRRHRPTVFISVPKKWIQLREAIGRRVDLEAATDAEVLAATHAATGGRLKWGLSAAGHLSTDVFRFFQTQGVNLMSGFGMTEATGGITMTPPDDYRDDSLGRALPGIELRVADDGELMIRGPYVMVGYLPPVEGEPGLDADGWLRTGDIVERDSGGHIKLVDRKKEIYKNVKGETIAPQRIESLFRDFDSVARVFVVGDHREYNTALIYPAPEYREAQLRGHSASEIKSHYRSLVVSVNKFLAPYERIVDFAIVERDLEEARGELTPKLTPRRKVVERNFADVIRLLYRRTDLHVGGVTVTYPNWLFQALGLTAEDIVVDGDRIVVVPTGATLTVSTGPGKSTRIGTSLYRHPPGPINLGILLSTPRLWLGNQELFRFAELAPESRERPGRWSEGIEWVGSATRAANTSALREEIAAALARSDFELKDLHHAALALLSDDPEGAADGVRLLERVASRGDGPLAEPARLLLARGADSAFLDIRRRAFRGLVPWERETRFSATLARFLVTPGIVLDAETRAVLCGKTLPDAILNTFLATTVEACLGPDDGRTAEQRASSLLRFVAAYGASHPTRYRKLRAFLVRTARAAERPAIVAETERAARAVEAGFREWLGATQQVAVDPETGEEYRWEDVIAFDDDVDAEARERLLAAIETEPFLREAIFLFSSGAQVRMSDIPPRGVFVRHLGTNHGKSVYRCTVQTRYQGSYDLAAVVPRDLSPAAIRAEIQDLLLCGDSASGRPLVEEFGGYFPGQNLWTEEFIPGETLERHARRLGRNPHDAERLQRMWPFFVWSALSAYVDFWNRTGRKQEILDASLANVVVPVEDFHTGARLVSISARRPHHGLLAMIRSFRDAFLAAAEERHAGVRGLAGWDEILAAVLEVVGEKEGTELLRKLLWQDEQPLPHDLRLGLTRFLESVEARGFLPMRLYFAAKRYRQWEELSPEATTQARARTLQELYETYGLQRLAASYPEARIRLFLETVLRNAPAPLVTGLWDLVAKLRHRELGSEEVLDALASLRAELAVGRDEDAFLARLSYPHLKPEDLAGFVPAESGGQRQSEMVVRLETRDGETFRVRHALNPKEVGLLHRLFLQAKLDVRFGPEHRYLVAHGERGQVLGGIYYEVDDGGGSAHLEKIAVAERWRRKGVADGLMKELFHRLEAAGVKNLTTGFFRPEFFYAHGFVIDRRYAGLVKHLAGA